MLHVMRNFALLGCILLLYLMRLAFGWSTLDFMTDALQMKSRTSFAHMQ